MTFEVVLKIQTVKTTFSFSPFSLLPFFCFFKSKVIGTKNNGKAEKQVAESKVCIVKEKVKIKTISCLFVKGVFRKG